MTLVANMKFAKDYTIDEIDTAIRAIDGAKGLDQILKILQAHIQSMGFDRFAYWLRWPSQEQIEPVLLTNYTKDYIDYYLANDFQSHDLVCRRSISTIVPFKWSSIETLMPLTSVQKHLFDAKRSVGMASGGSVPLHGPRQVKATLSVANDWKTEDFDALFSFHHHRLYLLAAYAHEKIMIFGLDRQNQHLALTKRETEILTWASRGKTYWEIGKILNIQESTVNNHMRNIFSALGVSSCVHATAKAITHGLIIP
jgi:DNA-binding CsgD family transcriptional regulator